MFHFSISIAFVCVFALLPDRKKGTYKLLFQELCNKAAELNMSFSPNIIMSDFEGCLRDVLKNDVRTNVFHFK